MLWEVCTKIMFTYINTIFASLFLTYLQMKCLQKLPIICYNSVCNLALKMLYKESSWNNCSQLKIENAFKDCFSAMYFIKGKKALGTMFNRFSLKIHGINGQ